MSTVQSWAETFAPIEAHYRNEVLIHTFGHLAPKKNKSYKFSILFMVSSYDGGTIDLIDSKFYGLDDSPWLYDKMHDLIGKFENTEKGCVYRIAGTMRNFRFYGTPKKVYSL
jgi:hypothetical protein